MHDVTFIRFHILPQIIASLGREVEGERGRKSAGNGISRPSIQADDVDRAISL